MGRFIRFSVILAAVLFAAGCAQQGRGDPVRPERPPDSPAPSALSEPADPVPDYLAELTERDNFEASDRVSLTLLRINEGIEIDDVPPYLKRVTAALLLALELRPAREGEAMQALAVAHPVSLRFADARDGRTDVYDLSPDSVFVNGRHYIAENPAALEDEDVLGVDLFQKKLFTLGQVLSIDPADVVSIEWAPANPPSDLLPVLLEGERAAEAMEELLGMVVRPREPGDNPNTGGADSFRITCRDGAERRLHYFGLVSVDEAEPAWVAVWFFVPEPFGWRI